MMCIVSIRRRGPHSRNENPYSSVGIARPGAEERPCQSDRNPANSFFPKSPAPSRRRPEPRPSNRSAIMRRFVHAATLIAVVFSIALTGCGKNDSATSQRTTPESQLTPEQLKNGIGPISSVTLDEYDEELADKGESIFTTKCSACHKFGERYVGPDLAGVLSRRSPEFVMNMMLNPAEMVEKHPEVKALLATYLTPMPSQNLTETDARAILEYFREKS